MGWFLVTLLNGVGPVSVILCIMFLVMVKRDKIYDD